MPIPTLDGIRSSTIQTHRLRQHLLAAGPEAGEAILFLHGNASSATFWEETMLAFAEGYRCLAPDLRGYGDTEPKPLDASRGFLDWVEDLLELTAALELGRYHLVGHSLGGTLACHLLLADAARVRTLTLVAPGSPYGFGGSKGLDGEPVWEDFAGSGGGTVNPDFPRRIAAQDRSDEPGSPRAVMNGYYWRPPFRPAREEALLSSLLSTRTGPEAYPGDMTPSANWPGVAPGRWGPINALSPKYAGNAALRLIALAPKPPVSWLRGADDQIVSDASLFDVGTLGKLGALPGWPGEEVYPPQPMVGQMRRVLERYQERGGRYREVVFENCGHTPYLEKPEAFNRALAEHLSMTEGGGS